MKRRWFLFGLAATATARTKQTSGRVPTADEELNRFATHYNAYVNNLRNGFLDLKSWDRARRSWRDMAGE